MGAVFRCVQQYSGASQARIGAAIDMAQGRVNEIINGRREVSRLDVYERIADGLDMPDDARHLLGRRPAGRGVRAARPLTWPHSLRSSACTPRRPQPVKRSVNKPALQGSWMCWRFEDSA
ncbi:helix-turn-helix domain-containing protein [Streptomyces sp. NBC_00212]|uniref:helix-turn-helix domain-containing protein n=1 Tax=Streptomyces sp. NBC_00212 TaxID=2975684 RepID=UPI003865D0A6